MKIKLKPGKYVLAVSGGVDSMVLLDILARRPDIELVIAHFNHGIRSDSDEDENLVVETAHRYGLPYAVGKGGMGPETSEEQARSARYAFLREVKEDFEAGAIITAHHQDDLIETALLNLLRGTGSRGLVAIKSNPNIIRPLIDTPKSWILQYAQNNSIKWREDTSNLDTTYLRNYIRHEIMSKLDASERGSLLEQIDKVAKNQPEKDKIIATISPSVIKGREIDRSAYTQLPTAVAKEILTVWLRDSGFASFDRKLIATIDTILRTARPGTRHDISRGVWIVVDKARARLHKSG